MQGEKAISAGEGGFVLTNSDLELWQNVTYFQRKCILQVQIIFRTRKKICLFCFLFMFLIFMKFWFLRMSLMVICLVLCFCHIRRAAWGKDEGHKYINIFHCRHFRFCALLTMSSVSQREFEIITSTLGIWGAAAISSIAVSYTHI